MPITFYHIIHVASIIMLAGLALGLVLSEDKKKYNMGFGLASILVFIAGFGLMAKMGYSFKENAWLTVKLLIWVALAMGVPLAIKRLNLSKIMTLSIVSTLLTIAVIVVYTKPF